MSDEYIVSEDDRQGKPFAYPKKARLMGRTVVVEQTMCHLAGKDPYVVHSKFTILKEGEGEHQEVSILLSPEDWTEIPFNPATDALIVIRNRSGDTPHGRYQVINRTHTRIPEVILVEGGWAIFPGEAMRGTPTGSIRLKPAGNEPVKVTISTFPR